LDAHVPDAKTDLFFADKVLEELVGFTNMDIEIDGFLEYLEDSGLVLEMREANRLLTLLSDACNALPRWINNGWSPNELLAKELAAQELAAETQGAKQPPLAGVIGIGRNDPCPCGSGKKFKRCHGSTAG
jgi:uncharacterized protein YecA (UPF0149 family)